MPRALPTNEASARSSPTHGPADQGTRGLVVVIGGIGNLDWCGIALRYLVKAKRLPLAIRVFSWGHGFGRWYADLTNSDNRDAKARSVAELIRLYRQSQPLFPVFLVAKSGGAGVAVKALELLDGDTVERVVLLAPALSPSYDLTPALRAVRREITVFWSPLDWLILGAGTRLFGTIDRVKTVGAGLVGFRAPAPDPGDPARSRAYQKLRQVRWFPRMATRGHFGGHMGPDSPLFLSKYVVPLLTVEDTTQP